MGDKGRPFASLDWSAMRAACAVRNDQCNDSRNDACWLHGTLRALHAAQHAALPGRGSQPGRKEQAGGSFFKSKSRSWVGRVGPETCLGPIHISWG